MKRIIHKIRLQPPEFRVMVAVITALIITAIIGFFWSSTFLTGTFQQKKTDTAPGPLSFLISNIKNTITTSTEENPIPFRNDNQVQVIDAGIQSRYDESNPANTTTITN